MEFLSPSIINTSAHWDTESRLGLTACHSLKPLTTDNDAHVLSSEGTAIESRGCQNTGAMHPWYSGALGNKFDLASVL